MFGVATPDQCGDSSANLVGVASRINHHHLWDVLAQAKVMLALLLQDLRAMLALSGIEQIARRIKEHDQIGLGCSGSQQPAARARLERSLARGIQLLIIDIAIK